MDNGPRMSFAVSVLFLLVGCGVVFLLTVWLSGGWGSVFG